MKNINFIVLAAGKGTRMRSAAPKVLHKLAGRSMLGHVIEATKAVGESKKIIVTGHGAGLVEEEFESLDTEFVRQDNQMGTAHAVSMAIPRVCDDATVIILYGDVPLIRPTTLKRMAAAASDQEMALLTISLENPDGYGRIVRNADGFIESIIEQKDATNAECNICEINTGVMALGSKQLREWLPQINNNNAQKEYYLTDIIAIARANGIVVKSINPESAEEVEGVNSRVQLSKLERVRQLELADRLMASGTTLADPARFDQRGQLSAGTDNFIDINCLFEGHVTIGSNVSIGPNCCISDSTIGDDVKILANTIIDSSKVGDGAVLGPFARIRPDTELAAHTKVGNFVETKKAKVGEGSKINHLSYVGDAEVGENVNIGAGTITCNYDGAEKHKTNLGDGVFVGSNSTLVAPITVENNGFIAAGSTITTQVPEDSLAVGRGKQRNIEGWKRPLKKED
jgi:bifunctional UDP-N-acetylglucosamine pyrophosphorylase/glucosamine-1-phosphate N-acetyltransferase